jgi:hypothetical protein
MVTAQQVLPIYLVKSNQANACHRQVILAHLPYGYVIQLLTTLMGPRFQLMVAGLRSKAK